MAEESKDLSNKTFQDLDVGDLVRIILKPEFGVSIKKMRIIDNLLIKPKL